MLKKKNTLKEKYHSWDSLSAKEKGPIGKKKPSGKIKKGSK